MKKKKTLIIFIYFRNPPMENLNLESLILFFYFLNRNIVAISVYIAYLGTLMFFPFSQVNLVLAAAAAAACCSSLLQQLQQQLGPQQQQLDFFFFSFLTCVSIPFLFHP